MSKRSRIGLFFLLTAMKTLINLLNVSVAEAIKFQLEVNYSRGTNFMEGELGKYYELNPKADQLFSADYRYGYVYKQSSKYRNC